MKSDPSSRAPFALDTVDIRLLRLFLRVAEAGGLSAAQGELNLSLSTISERIGALEERLGVTLCKRGRGGFSLTEAGRQVLEEAQKLMGSLDDFSRRIAGLRSDLSGSLTIGLVDNIISDPRLPLSAVFASLAEKAPALQLTLDVRPPGELLRELATGRLDLAIGSFPRAPLGFGYVDLHDEVHNFHCGAGHPLFAADDAGIDVERVRGHRIIGRSYWAARDLRLFALTTPHAIVSNMEAEAQLILSGAYLGYLPDHYARPFIAAGRMRVLRPNLFSYRARFQIAGPEDWRDRPLTRTFIDLLQAAVRAGG